MSEEQEVKDLKQYTDHEVERDVLVALIRGTSRTQIGEVTAEVIRSILKIAINSEVCWDDKPRIAQAICSLAAKGLVYIDFSIMRDAHEWRVSVTDRGRASAEGKDYIPTDPEDYFARFVSDIPKADDVVLRYVREALETYRQRCYLACSVMLGVAAEAVFLDMAESFSKWLPTPENKDLGVLLKNRRPFAAVVREVHTKLNDKKELLDEQLRDGLGVQVTAVAELIRNYRNDAGHPSGNQVSPETCYASLTVLPIALRRMYELKEFFESKKRQS